MKKKILMRCLMGAPIGLVICTVITIIFSLIYGNGEYFATSPDLIAECGNEIRAVILQTVFSMIDGAVWGGTSVIWEVESWSLLKMSLTHLTICSAASFSIAYFMQWIPHNVLGACFFFGAFWAIYAITWLLSYTYIKKQIVQINNMVQKKNQLKN